MPVLERPHPGIHPTATVHPSAEIDPSASVGREVIIGPDCRIGARTVVHPRVIIERNTTIGEGNVIHSFAVLGGDPQDRKYDPSDPGLLIVGNDNVIRESVTLNRSTGSEYPTVMGSGCYLMVGSHMGHNSRLRDGATLGNCTALAGWSAVGARSVISSHCAVHQFVRVGELCMFQAMTRVSMHVPPFCIVAHANGICGLNAVGLRRAAHIDDEDRRQIKALYKAIYRDRGGRSIQESLTELSDRRWNDAPRRFLEFFSAALDDKPPRNRGICPSARTRRERGTLVD